MNISSVSINRPVLASVISILIGSFSTNAVAQVTRYQDIRKKNIRIRAIDTTDVLIYETLHARLYFAKKDIIDHVGSLDEVDRKDYAYFLDVLRTSSNRIEIVCDTIYDIEDPSAFAKRPSGKDPRDVLVWGMMDIAAELLLQGKVLPYSKTTGLFETGRIKCRNEAAEFPLNTVVPMGTRLLVFRFPDGVRIHGLVTALGE